MGPDATSFDRVSLVEKPPSDENCSCIPLGRPSRFPSHPLVRMYSKLPVSTAAGVPIADYLTRTHLGPSDEQLRRFSEEDRGKAPLMLNLLKYENLGRYLRYAAVGLRHIGRVGATPTFSAPVEGAAEWDEIAIVRFPSRSAFLDMLGCASYQRAETRHREAGLASTRLYVLSELAE